MTVVTFTLEGQIGSACYPSGVLGKRKANEKFNLLVEELQIKDQVKNPISGDRLIMFANSFGSVQLVSLTPIKPWIRITRPPLVIKKCKCKK
jgi:hypothetical protein